MVLVCLDFGFFFFSGDPFLGFFFIFFLVWFVDGYFDVTIYLAT